MNLRQWSRSNIDYGRKLLNSGIEGARSGEETFLHGRSLEPFLNDSVKHALTPATIGLCIGFLGAFPRNGHNSRGRALACGLLGGVIGLSASVAWQSRRLVRTIASNALRKIGRTRDEHWLEKHPIDYA
jgi:hypothetical protein